MKIEYHEEAKRDLYETLEYYHTKSPRLVQRFLAELEDLQRNIRRNPSHFHLTLDGSYRRANFRKFKHHMLYRVESELVRIFVIRHDHQQPDFGLDRT